MIEIKRNGEYNKYFEEVDKTARDFFGLQEDSTQIAADQKTYEYSLQIGGCSIIALENGKLLGWGFAFPTNRKLMDQFINGNITENQLFWMTKKDDNYDAIYLCAIFVYEEYRRSGLGSKILNACIDPLLKKDVCIFYEPYTEEGKKLGESAFKYSYYEVKVKKHK